jgi:hypothetical protein
LEDHTRYTTHVIPMGNYVIAGVGNYVIVNPSNLGNYVIADTEPWWLVSLPFRTTESSPPDGAAPK